MHSSRTMRGPAAVMIFAILGLVPSMARGADDVTKIRFTAMFSSISTTLYTLPDGHVYGWNHFTGTTRWAGQDAAVDFLGSVNYINGSGPFEGFITLTRADGVILAFRIEGDALAADTPQGLGTDFSGRVEIIQGTDEFEGATGIGVAMGSRRGPLGSPVTLSFGLAVIQR